MIKYDHSLQGRRTSENDRLALPHTPALADFSVTGAAFSCFGLASTVAASILAAMISTATDWTAGAGAGTGDGAGGADTGGLASLELGRFHAEPDVATGRASLLGIDTDTGPNAPKVNIGSSSI